MAHHRFNLELVVMEEKGYKSIVYDTIEINVGNDKKYSS